MRIFSFLVTLAVLGVPVAAAAHGTTTNFQDIEGSSGMMQYVEEQSLGSDLHEEMEELMEKMMAGEMTEQEAGRMAELMNQYPGPQAMMMNRMMGGTGFGMMPAPWSQAGNAWSWFVILVPFVWLVVGILGAVWLWQSITKK